MSLLTYLSEVPAPRKPKGGRHPLEALLKATLLGLLAGLTCIEHIAQYVWEQWAELAAALGFTHSHPPDALTYCRVLSQLDSRVLTEAFANWMSEGLAEKTFDVSVDGKACRGVKTGSDSRDTLMLVNVFAPNVQVVLSQWPVGKQ